MNSSKQIEVDVPSILKRDGVLENDLFDVNHETVNIEKFCRKNRQISLRVSSNHKFENNSMTVIAQMPR